MTKITVITQAECHYCDEAKALLGRLSAELDYEVDVIDLETEDGRKLALAAGMVFPPAVLIDGRPLSYGRLSERLLRRELEHSRTAI